MTPTVSPEDEVSVDDTKEEGSEFDPSFFDIDDEPYIKSGGKIKVIVAVLVLAAVAVVAYFLLFNNKEEAKRVMAIPEESVPEPEPQPEPEAKPEATPENKDVKEERTAEEEKKAEEKKPEKKVRKKKKAKKAKKRSGGGVAALIKKGWAYLDQGQNGQAVKTFKSAIARSPKSAGAHLGLAEAYNMMGKKKSAKTHYQKYLQLKPDAPDRVEIEAILKNL